MKNIFEAIILKGGYDLDTLLKKIDTYHIEGRLTDSERTELYSRARMTAKGQYDVNHEIEKLWEAVRALQSKDNSEGDTDTATPVEFVQPTGAHDAYSVGDVVIYNEKTYKSIIHNNVWSPDTYPAGWEEVE